jgi:hypothetical protein
VADPSVPDDDAATVRHLLAAAGLHPPDEDLRSLTSQYGDVRRQLAEMWAVDVGEEEPATVYRAATPDGPPERR